MARIIFIPSYGTDSSLYDNLRASNAIEQDCLFTEWIDVGNTKSLRDYAKRFADEYNIKEEDLLVGTSLGGVLAIEIQKTIPVSKIIIISSLKTRHEKPRLFKFLSVSKLYALFFPQVLKFALDLVIPFYGKNVKSYLWFRRVFKQTDNRFLKWGLREIVNWQNEELASNLVHIHGSKDPLFPIKNAIEPQYVIEGGSHAMIRFRSQEIADIINKEIS